MPEDKPTTVKPAPEAIFCRRTRGNRPGAWRRIKIPGNELSGPLPRIAESVDSYFAARGAEKPPVHILKADHFSSVIRIQTNGRDFVVKNEHARTIFEFLAKGFRKSRAAKTWDKGRRLIARDLETACPLALIEDFFFFFRTNSFFISDCLPGILLRTYLDDPAVAAADKMQAAEKTVDMLCHWHRAGVTHGDPKASNIIIDQDRLYLIDPEDVTIYAPGKASRRAMARDWAIVLHNWQNQPDIRQVILGRILDRVDSRQHFFATRLIKKFWKDEYAGTGWGAEQTAHFNQLVKVLSAGVVPPDWECEAAPTGCIHAVSAQNATHCRLSPRAFRRGQSLSAYFKKKQHPVRGVLSMALALRICGFHLPEIIAGGLSAKYEYLIFEGVGRESFLLHWKNAQTDPLEKSSFLSSLGAETGRLHAMGFICGGLSLNTVSVEKTAGSYKVVFSPTCRTRRQRWLSARQAAKDWQPLKDELAALMSAGDMATVSAAYEKAYRRR